MIYVLIVFLILLIMPIKIVVTKDDKHNDIDIFLTKIFNIRIDFDDFIRYLLTTKANREQITLSSIIYNYHLFQKSKNIIVTICKMIRLKKLTFIIKTKSYNLETDTWSFFGSWIVLGYFQNTIHGYFKTIENEYYNHQISSKFNFNIESQFNIRLIYIIFSITRHIKDLPKIIRFIKKD